MNEISVYRTTQSTCPRCGEDEIWLVVVNEVSALDEAYMDMRCEKCGVEWIEPNADTDDCEAQS